MKKGMLRGLILTSLLVLGFSSHAFATQFKLLSAWAPNYIFNVGVLNNFEKNLAEVSGGKMKGSSAEFVGDFRFREVAKCMV
ncbi:hypothetical protein [Geoalkalibacter sp.]|uniref:hypothetical protein n=1 Tax=Geoalkalibacter sp. TaxID=3041440 RepID=UPI00272E262B|nr:hypothetical protein [Geoalkalibacter sp.]